MIITDKERRQAIKFAKWIDKNYIQSETINFYYIRNNSENTRFSIYELMEKYNEKRI